MYTIRYIKFNIHFTTSCPDQKHKALSLKLLPTPPPSLAEMSGILVSHSTLIKCQQSLLNRRAFKWVAGKVIDTQLERPPHPCFHIFL